MGGPAAEAIKKALRVRRKMFALAAAKENALRELAGYPPLQTWWQSCFGGFVALLRVTICRAFCPCCLVRWRFKTIFCPRTTCYGRCFYEGDYENEVLKNFLGFILGSVLTLLLYAWLCLSKDYPIIQAAVISCAFGVVLTLGMAFAETVRCLVFLTIPSMFSKKGRSFLLTYATILVFTYPAANVATNLKVMADSATCGQSLMMNETKKLLWMVSEPLSAMMDALEVMYEHIKAFASLLMQAFMALLRAVKEIINTVAAVFKWLWNIVETCNEKMGEPYRKCKKAFDDAYDDCRDRLGIFGFLCKIVSAASHLCNLARVGELLCVIVGAIKEFIVDKVKEATVGSITDLREMFWFGINITRRYSYNMTQSRSYEEVKEAIMVEISAAVSSYMRLLVLVDNIMMLTVFSVFLKAWKYRRAYLTEDSFDNYYITQHVYAIDERRAELGRDRVFPMKANEEVKYVPLFSYRLTRKEARKLSRGMLMWSLAAYNGFYYMLTDYGLYWLLSMIARHLNVKTTSSIPPFMQLHVNGEGPLSDMYRSMVGLLDPLAQAGLDIDSSSCLPNPSPPDLDAYRIITTLYVICLFLTVGEAYGLRMRRAVASCYYPERERQRAVWVYNQILYRRASFIKFTRRQIRRKYMDNRDIMKQSIRGRLVRQFPNSFGRLLKMCGYEWKNCISCGMEGKPQDMENFTHCVNYGCTAVYCNECFVDLNRICTACLNPVDYGDLSDASDEVDSSEDEDLKALKKVRAKAKRRKLEALRKDRGPRTVMTRFKDFVDLPHSTTKRASTQHKRDDGDKDDDDGDYDDDDDDDDEADEQPLLNKDKGRKRNKPSDKNNSEVDGRGSRFSETATAETDQNNSEAGVSSSEISSSEDDESRPEFDQSYQYADKADLTTSSAEETSDSAGDWDWDWDPDRSGPNTNASRAQTSALASSVKPVEYVTLDIFNVTLRRDDRPPEDVPELVVSDCSDRGSVGAYGAIARSSGYGPRHTASQSDSDLSPCYI